jgi:DNA-binding CsgD family transcriptional regulator
MPYRGRESLLEIAHALGVKGRTVYHYLSNAR